ncbi:hypothetical protein SLNSH_18305 [Alsobacter soli]|uniref:Uncharacterized protein n=2 Tax=Alsobacter soli TaxID=2109933 RepID=A0A2T1HPL4_9HYPH|nr:hypothetical protein SLNSH_18305 [Alsobacter soli]
MSLNARRIGTASRRFGLETAADQLSPRRQAYIGWHDAHMRLLVGMAVAVGLILIGLAAMLGRGVPLR